MSDVLRQKVRFLSKKSKQQIFFLLVMFTFTAKKIPTEQDVKVRQRDLMMMIKKTLRQKA